MSWWVWKCHTEISLETRKNISPSFDYFTTWRTINCSPFYLLLIVTDHLNPHNNMLRLLQNIGEKLRAVWFTTSSARHWAAWATEKRWWDQGMIRAMDCLTLGRLSLCSGPGTGVSHSQAGQDEEPGGASSPVAPGPGQIHNPGGMRVGTADVASWRKYQPVWWLLWLFGRLRLVFHLISSNVADSTETGDRRQPSCLMRTEERHWHWIEWTNQKWRWCPLLQF